MIRHADLRLHGNDYLEFHQRVLRFVELAGVGYNLIKKSGAKQEDVMRYLLDYMERYRAASFSLPTTGKSEEEDPATFNKRKVTAQNLLSVYQSEILAFEKMIEPKQSGDRPYGLRRASLLPDMRAVEPNH